MNNRHAAERTAAALVVVIFLLGMIVTAAQDTRPSPCSPPCPDFTVPAVNTPHATMTPDVQLNVAFDEFKSQVSIESIQESTPMELVTLLALALVANRLTELVKKGLSEKFTNLPEWIVLLISLIVGVVLALARQANLFTDGAVDPLLGMILTGIVIGACSNFTHSLTEIVSTWQENFEQKPAPATPAPQLELMAQAKMKAAAGE